jgi:hypothetical protein
MLSNVLNANKRRNSKVSSMPLFFLPSRDGPQGAFAGKEACQFQAVKRAGSRHHAARPLKLVAGL